MKFVALLLAAAATAAAQEALFSGPQPGEPLPPFRALAANGPNAGREVDFISEFGNAPIVLVFAHYIDRNVYRTLWPTDRYVAGRAGTDLKTLFVYLAPEKVEGERRMAQVAKSLSLQVPVAVALEGVEGPGAYGLNRQVGVTAIVAKDRKVVASLAFVQPGQSAAQKIIAEAVKLVGGSVPTDEELNRGPGGRRMAGAAEPPDFSTRVQPMLVKAGCFSGACHGAGSGQKGFKLSLLGYDPEFDYQAIVYQYRGRRINPANPADSLLLKKATMKIAHGGGPRFADSSETWRTVLAWIAGGVPYESASQRRITGLDITPAATMVEKPGARLQLRVTARFSDGSQNDVTRYALYTSGDEAIATAGPTGEAAVLAAGETGVTARYLGQFRTARVGMRFAGDPASIARATAASSGLIDRLVNENLRRLRLEPSPLASDAEFLRRVHLDVIGTMPAVEEARAFLADRSPDKRTRAVDRLLERPEYSQYWTLWLLDLFRLQSRKIGEKNLERFSGWLRDELAADASFAGLTRQMLTAVGDGAQLPAANFLRESPDTKLLAELATEALMGSRSRCARCHDHPFDSWTQTQYHQFASFFVRVLRTDAGIRLEDHGEIEHPKTGKPVAPGFPDGRAAVIRSADRREALAEWLAAPDNGYFARSMANRVWARLMARGLIEPVDNLSASNPASNPELLDALAGLFRERYSLKALIRAIASSDAYQRSAESNEVNRLDTRFYSRALAKPLNAYVYADAVAQVTGIAEPFAKLVEGTRAIQVADSRVESYLLDVCGRCQREGTCDVPDISGGVPLALHLMNGPAINAKIAAAGSRLDRLRSQGAAPGAVVEEFYLAALSRPPTGAEKDFWLTRIRQSADPQAATEDLIWALLTSRSFVFNR